MATSKHEPIVVGKLFTPPGRLKIVPILQRIIDTYGEPQHANTAQDTLLERAWTKLSQDGGRLDNLTSQEKRAFLLLYWSGHKTSDGFHLNQRHLEAWQSWADSHWKSRSASRRLITSYIRYFDPENPHMVETAPWLQTRLDRETGHVGQFATAVRLLTSPNNLAEDIKRLKLEALADAAKSRALTAVLSGSGYLLHTVNTLGSWLPSLSFSEMSSLIAHLDPLLEHQSLTSAPVSAGSRHAAEKSLVEGMIGWASLSRSEADAAQNLAIQTVLRVLPDIRVNPGRWNQISDEAQLRYKQWVNRRTLDRVFEIINSLPNPRPSMWDSRRDFWKQYIPHMENVRLLCGSKAMTLAQGMSEDFSKLSGGQPDHCGMMMQLRAMGGDVFTVVEINNNASAMFWSLGSENPDMTSSAFSLPQLRSLATNTLPHQPSIGWEPKFSAHLLFNYGI